MSEKTKRWLIVLGVGFLLADIVIGAVLFKYLRRDRQAEQLQQHSMEQLLEQPKQMTEQQAQELRTQTLGEMHRLVVLNSEPQVMDGAVQLMLSNSEESRFAVRVTLIRLDTQEVIARTQLVDPGWRVESLPLETELPPGTYFCLARTEFVDPAQGGVLGETARQILLTVPGAE